MITRRFPAAVPPAFAAVLLVLAAAPSGPLPAGAGEPAASAAAAADPARPASLAAAKSQAAASGQLLLLEIGAEWCGPCKRFDRDSREDAALRAGLSKVVLFQLDGEKGEGPKVAADFGLGGYPTYILMTAPGDVVDRWVGYAGPAELLATLEANLAEPMPLADREARYATAPTVSLAENLGRVADSRGDYVAAYGYYSKAEELKTDPAADYTVEAFYAQAYGLRKEQFTVEQAAAGADRAMNSNATAGEKVDVALLLRRLTARTRTPEVAAPALARAMELADASAAPELADARKELQVEHALLVLKDPEKALAYKRQTLPEGWQENPGRLNGFAWWCFENRVNLDEAETLARKGVQLAPPGTERATILDTLAEICAAKGGCGEAAELMAQAVQDAPESSYYKQQLERFQKMAAEQGGGSR